jgi:hypothetical protein
MALVSDWEVVVWCLSPTQDKLGHLVSVADKEKARRLADGMGRVTPEMEARDPGVLWDWSHVRDSSPEAIAAMAKFLRQKL